MNLPLENIPEIISEEINPEKQEQLKQLEKLISELGTIDKGLMLLYLDGKSYAEIGFIMGLSSTNVGTKLGRIKEKLKLKFSQTNN